MAHQKTDGPLVRNHRQDVLIDRSDPRPVELCMCAKIPVVGSSASLGLIGTMSGSRRSQAGVPQQVTVS